MKRGGLLSEEGMCRAFRVLAGTVFTVLLLCSLVMTYVNVGLLGDEVVWIEEISPLRQVWVLLAVLVGLLLVRVVAVRIVRVPSRGMDAAAVVISLVAALAAVMWVWGSTFYPVADQEKVVLIAGEMNAGDFSALQAGGYANLHRHQLGMISLLRLVLAIFGDYRAMQTISALLVGVIYMLSYLIVRQICPESRTAQVCELGLLVLFVPLMLYTPFVYGELPSTVCLLAGMLLFLRSLEKGGLQRFLLLGLCCGAAVVLRRNAVVVLLGFLIAALVRLAFARDGRAGKAMAAILAGVVLMQGGISAVYARHIPEGSEGMPAILYVAMGLTEGAQPGWWNGYNERTFESAGYRAKEASEAAKRTIDAFFEAARKDPGYAFGFMAKKMQTQWESPMLQAMVMNRPAPERSALCQEVYYGSLRSMVEKLMKVHQVFVYAMVLYLLCRRKSGSIASLALLIGVFGGFLFTLMWEAKTRYVFPYMLMLLPYAAIGFSCLAENMDSKLAGIWKKRADVAPRAF